MWAQGQRNRKWTESRVGVRGRPGRGTAGLSLWEFPSLVPRLGTAPHKPVDPGTAESSLRRAQWLGSFTPGQPLSSPQALLPHTASGPRVLLAVLHQCGGEDSHIAQACGGPYVRHRSTPPSPAEGCRYPTNRATTCADAATSPTIGTKLN